MAYITNGKQNEITTIPADVSQADIQALYLSWLNFIDASPKTIETYTRNVRQLMKYLSGEGIKAPERADLMAYKARLLAEGKKPSTVTAYIMAAKQFFKWTEQTGLYPDIAKHVKGARITTDHKKDALTSDEAKALLLTADRKTLTGKRDYALLLLMLTGGLRTIEAARANIEDCKRKGDGLIIRLQGKGHSEKDDLVTVPKETKAALEDYLRARKATPQGPLFTSLAHRNAGQRLTTKSISRIIKAHLTAAGLVSDRITAHSLRHTAGTALHELTGNLYTVQKYMRHANPATTEIYLHNDTEKQDADFTDKLYKLFHEENSIFRND